MAILNNLVDFKNLKPCGPLAKRTRLFTGYACNINCKFCFYRGKKHFDIRPKIYRQLEEGQKFGIKDWDISGGEPSILPYWQELLTDMKDMGFRNIACITNGYKFADADFLKQCRNAGLNELLFSLHESKRDIHDGMTGVKGSYDHLMSAIANAKDCGMKIRINVVVTRDNYKNLPEIAQMALMIKPVAFNFLPFRVENSASKKNAVRYSKIAPYIKASVDALKESIDKIAIRYVPFCLFKGYETYVAGYLQRVFDEYEWSEYALRHFENSRKENKKIGSLDCDTDKWQLEIKALSKSVKSIANHSIKCLLCKYSRVCDGIWKSYAKVWGSNEFKPVWGAKINRICQ